MIIQTILEGLDLRALLVLICAVGIRKGAVGMVHLYFCESIKSKLIFHLRNREKQKS